jgi:ribosomal protein S18 acetylase RimI-like enzyme
MSISQYVRNVSKPLLAVFVFLTIANAAAPNLPGLEKDATFTYGPSTIRLISTWDGPFNGERHTNFNIDFYCGTWINVGTILVQVIDPANDPYYEGLGIGVHVRIRNIDIKEQCQKRGFGALAMVTLLELYRSKGGFQCFKLEATDSKPHLDKMYRRLGFKKMQAIDQGSDVSIYTKALK